MSVRVGHSARGRGTNGIEVPNNVVQLQEKLPITLDWQSIRDDLEHIGIRLKAAPCFVRARDKVDEKGKHVSDLRQPVVGCQIVRSLCRNAAMPLSIRFCCSRASKGCG